MKFQTKSNGVFDIKISPDQQRFACALMGSPLIVYALPSGAELLSKKDRNYDSVWAVEWLRAGESQYLLAGYGENGYMRVFDDKGTSLIETKHKSEGGKDAAQIHRNSIYQLTVLDGALVSVSDDRCINMLSIGTWLDGPPFVYERKQEARLTLGAGWIRFCALQGGTLAGINSNAIQIVDRTTRKVVKDIVGKDEKFSCIATGRDGELITVSWDGRLKLWDIATGAQVREIPLGLGSLQVSHIGDQIVHTAGGNIVFRNAATLEVMAEVQVHETKVKCFDLSTDGRWLVSGTKDGEVAITELPTPNI